MQHLTPSSSSGQPQLPSGTPAPWQLPPRAPSSRCRVPLVQARLELKRHLRLRPAPPQAAAPLLLLLPARAAPSHTRDSHRSCGTHTDPAGHTQILRALGTPTARAGAHPAHSNEKR